MTTSLYAMGPSASASFHLQALIVLRSGFFLADHSALCGEAQGRGPRCAVAADLTRVMPEDGVGSANYCHFPHRNPAGECVPELIRGLFVS